MVAGWLGVCLPAFFTGCVSAPLPQSPADIPRAAPAYVQWLEREAMHTQSAEYLSMVTGTPLQWRSASVDSAPDDAGASSARVHTLLTAAPTWLYINPGQLLLPPGGKVWPAVRTAAPLLMGLGMQGLYVSPAGEHAAVWQGQTPDAASPTPAVDDNDAIVSLRQAHYMGNDADFDALANVAAGQNWQLGTDIVPPATGRGPDFMLAAQGVRQYPGLYILLEVPRSQWAALPPATAPWDCAPLSDAQTQALAAEGLLPSRVSRDALPWVSRGGWSSTGEVRGADGVTRRFVYRYDQTPARPLLNWDSPTGTARAVLFASVIREVGALRQTVAGLHIAPLAGLDADTGDTPALEPAPSALRDLTREIRRYGGWSVQQDALPPALIPMAQRNGADFCADSLTTPLAELALLTGDARPLADALRRGLDNGVCSNRLMHGMTGAGLPLLPLTEHPALRARLEEQVRAHGWHKALRPDALHLTGTGVAALSMGLRPEEATAPRHAAGIAQRHTLLTAFYAGLPGLFAINAQEVTGVLPAPDAGTTPDATGYTLPGTDGAAALTTPTGQSAGAAVYAPLVDQLQDDTSFAARLHRILNARKELGVATWRIASAHSGEDHGCLALLLRGTGREAMLLLVNFSTGAGRVRVPEGMTAARVVLGTAPQKNAPTVWTLPPLSCVWLAL